MSQLNEETARAIVEAFHAGWSKGDVEAFHAGWSKGDVEAMLSWCHDDVTNFLNTGAPDGGPLRLYGKADLRAFLTTVSSVLHSVTVPLSFSYRDGVGRAQIEAYVQHRKTRIVLSGTFRQVILFDDFRIAAIEEFHDGARMKAFWDMVTTEEAERLRAQDGDVAGF